jgi:hypothetical protein
MEIKGFNIAKKMLYSDTPVPDIFINQYASQVAYAARQTFRLGPYRRIIHVLSRRKNF